MIVGYAMINNEIFQFHIALLDSEPLIWRRFQVFGDISFDDFHHIIQDVMGWHHSHLYEFKFKKYSIIMPGTETDPLGELNEIYGDELYLYEVLKRAGSKFLYIYDFGDNWEHEILFEKRLPADRQKIYPVCIEGEMACPPEDIGGIWLFYERLGIARGEVEDVDKEWADHLRTFIGNYDPEYFNLDEINNNLNCGPYGYFLLEEVVSDYLDTVDEPFRLCDCLEELKLEKTKENEETVQELLVLSGEVVQEKNIFYPKASLLKDFAIRIQPTDFEIQNGVLIPGHRLLPFLPEGVLSDEVDLLHNNEPLEDIDIFLSEAELDTYFGLLDVDDIPILGGGPDAGGEKKFVLLVFDLASFYKENRFVVGDSIILNVEDFSEHIFSIRCEPIAGMKTHAREIKAWDDLFMNSLKNVLRNHTEADYLYKQLLYTYFYMGRSTTREQRKIPGTEVALLLRQTKEIRCSEIEDIGKILHFADMFVSNLPHKDS